MIVLRTGSLLNTLLKLYEYKIYRVLMYLAVTIEIVSRLAVSLRRCRSADIQNRLRRTSSCFVLDEQPSGPVTTRENSIISFTDTTDSLLRQPCVCQHTTLSSNKPLLSLRICLVPLKHPVDGLIKSSEDPTAPQKELE
jgi:hypothetical protein